MYMKGILVHVLSGQNCVSQLKPALFQFCVRMDTVVVQHILNQETLCHTQFHDDSWVSNLALKSENKL